jgi:uncharacterized protein (TIGR02328 family)
MRLWHKALLPYLPRQQLLGQWRECCLIAKNIADNGTPNHILVNKIMDYPEEHFDCFALLVYGEMLRRGYKCDYNRFGKYRKLNPVEVTMEPRDCFKYWHNVSYAKICMANLLEKFDCGGITIKEFEHLLNGYEVIAGEEYML